MLVRKANVERTIFDSEHEMFRSSFRTFLEREAIPHWQRWESSGRIDRSFYENAGRSGFLGMAAPEEMGGGSLDDFRFNAVIVEECQRLGLASVCASLALHNDVCLPYFLKLASQEQQERWLPGICAGTTITAIAMTEPGTGSDLAGISTSAERDRDHYIVNGVKTFITSGINADLVIVVVRTDKSDRHGGLSLLVVERGAPGFDRGRNLEKLGLHGQDTAELFFDNVEVPASDRLDSEGAGFRSLAGNLPQERLSLGVTAVAAAETAVSGAVQYTRERQAFGKPLTEFQNTRFVLAECATEVALGRAFVDQCIGTHLRGRLTAEEAAMAKWWCTEMQVRVVSACLQLYGGYGYMTESPVARAFADARVATIFGGTTEIMKEIIGRSLASSGKA
jgi:alkylation response protein AidB-like acyl-CoA dehydrogenase